MQKDPYVERIALHLSDDALVATRRRRNGSLHTLRLPVGDDASLTAAAASLCTQLLPALASDRAVLSSAGASSAGASSAGASSAGASTIELVLVNERPLQRLLAGTLPKVALLCTAGLEDHFHACLADEASDSDSGGGGQLVARGPAAPSFALVGDAAELFFPADRLSQLCPTANVLPVDERLAADGSIVHALTKKTTAQVVQRARELAVPAAAIVLLHSGHNPTHEGQLATALHNAGLLAVPSAQLLPAHRGGDDERLRVRAAVLNAALAIGCQTDLMALQAGLPTDARLRFFLLRSDGGCAPPALVAPWQQLLSPLSATLRGAALDDAVSHERFFILAADEASDAISAPPAAPALPSADLRFAALMHRPQAAELPSLPALCLGIPWELPATCVTVDTDPDAALQRTRSLASALGYAPPAADNGRATAGLQSVPLLRVSRRLAITRGALAAKAQSELSQPLWVEASGAQQSGLLASTLSHLYQTLALALAMPTAISTNSAGSPSAVTSHASASDSPPFWPYDWTVDLRYHGQTGVLSLRGVGTGGPAGSAATDLVVRFVAEHQRVYGFCLPECPVELVQVRVTVRL